MSIKHGTTSGYHAHRRLEQNPCADCKDAINEYLRAYRAGKGADRTRLRDKIRRRALIELREQHRADYDILVDKFTLNLSGDEDGDG